LARLKKVTRLFAFTIGGQGWRFLRWDKEKEY
jgi:cytochrome c